MLIVFTLLITESNSFALTVVTFLIIGRALSLTVTESERMYAPCPSRGS